jgi:hypothetical protein
MAWKGFGAKLRIMCQSSDLFLYRCRLQACGLATPEELTPLPAPTPKPEQDAPAEAAEPEMEAAEALGGEKEDEAEAPMEVVA